MNRLALALSLCAALAAPAHAATATRNFGVNGFDRVRLDGDYRVTLVNGVAPFARAKGSPQALDMVSMRVEGRTLVIKMSRSSGWGGMTGGGNGAVEIVIGTHELSGAQVNGAGALGINRVNGMKFEVSVQGAGLLTIDRVEVDQLAVNLAGTASARMAGKAATSRMTVRGTSTVDGEALSVKDATIDVQGPSSVKLTVTSEAKVDAIGVSTVTLSGSPSCTVKAGGSANVTGCK